MTTSDVLAKQRQSWANNRFDNHKVRIARLVEKAEGWGLQLEKHKPAPRLAPLIARFFSFFLSSPSTLGSIDCRWTTVG